MPAIPRRPHDSALAHSAGAPGPGDPRRSTGRASQTPRDARDGGRHSRPGTLPPVPGRRPFPSSLPAVAPAALLAAALLAALALITWQVVSHGALTAVDDRLGGGRPAPVPQFLSDLGGLPAAGTTAALCAAVAAWRARRRRWLPPAAAAAALAAAGAVVVPLKAWTARTGPDGLPLGDYPGYYPSGHAATAAVAYGCAALLLGAAARLAVRRLLAAAAAVLNGAVGTGLVACGYHWPLDVVASWCLSGALLCAVAAALRRCS
ncbi:hypothetical protein GCM10010406_30230 [Streptomyces thermolineatus]|uniref:Phosphatidic acid phosphatase type 2/haloperoxidase domain-containing protein n=1 Tax=Streptomyces thermolineatus TaxID=44033 RepID=A0ABN3LZM4_9ACTN